MLEYQWDQNVKILFIYTLLQKNPCTNLIKLKIYAILSEDETLKYLKNQCAKVRQAQVKFLTPNPI